MSNFYLCLLLAGLCTLASCHHVPGHEGGHDGHEHEHDHQTPAESHQGSGHLPCLKIAPSNAEFAFKFYRQVASKEAGKNIFFSPVGISTAFMLVTLGANKTTVDEIFVGIGFDTSLISVKEIDDGFRHLMHLMNRPEAQIEWSLGTALFSSETLPVKQTIVDEARDLLQADILHTDFQNLEEAVKKINSYVEKKTHGKIVEGVSSLNPDTVTVLVSYIFMKGYWEKPFDPRSTSKQDFFVNNDTTVQVDMMYRNGYYYTYHDEELACEVVRVPYQGNASALFILPEKGKLSQVEQALGRETLLKWETSQREQRIELLLPKVTLKSSYDVKEIVKELGITEVFTDQADLSGFSDNHNFKISKITHKAFLNIHENGTEAAATTVVEIIPSSLPPRFEFNRPYLVMLVDHVSRAIAFLGRVVNPNEH